MKTLLTIFLSAFLLLSCASAYAAAPSGGNDSRFLRAVALFSEGRYDQASVILRSIAGEDSADDAVFYYLGICDYYLQDFDEAEIFLQQAVQMDSTNYWYRAYLAEVKSAREDYDGALSMYEEILRDWPKKTDTYYSLLSLYAHTGKVQKLLETIDAIESVAGRNERIALAKYDILLRQGKPQEAYSVLDEYNRDLLSPQLLCVMGDYQASLRQDSLALALYDQALQIDPTIPEAILGKAEVLRVKGCESEYFASLRTVISSAETSSEIKGQYFARLFRVVDRNWLLANKKIFDEILSTAVRLHPKDLPLAGTYVQFEAVMGDWNLLLEICEDAFSRFPGTTDFLSFRCIAYYNLKDEESFIRENERIISTAPNDTSAVLEALSSIGDMRYRQGDSKQAFKAYDAALRISPTYAPVLNNYAYYLALKGKKLQKALAMSKQTVEANPDNATYLDTYGWLLYLLRRPQDAKPVFKHALLYGGKENVETLWHYARVLDALGETDLAKVYYNLVESKKNSNTAK